MHAFFSIDAENLTDTRVGIGTLVEGENSNNDMK